MFWNNLVVVTNFFVEIAVELTVLFIGITFLVGFIQEYVSKEKIKKAMGRAAQNHRHHPWGRIWCSHSFLFLLNNTTSTWNAQG